MLLWISEFRDINELTYKERIFSDSFEAVKAAWLLRL